jgi:hypothetical protein
MFDVNVFGVSSRSDRQNNLDTQVILGSMAVVSTTCSMRV